MARFPHFRQLDAMDCGPACLRMVAHHHGKRISQAALRQACNIGKAGVSMRGIAEAADGVGLRAMAVKLRFTRLATEAPLPCIVHWEGRHFIVVHRVSRSKVEVADPASGLVSYNHADFQKGWLHGAESPESSGLVMLLEPSPQFFRPTSVADGDADKQNGLHHFAAYLWPHKRLLIQVALCLLVGLGINLITPFLAQSMIDLGIGNLDLKLVTILCLAQLMMAVGQTASNLLQGWLLLHIGSRLSLGLITDFLRKLLRLPLHFFDTRTAGDIMQRVGDHTRVQQFLTSATLGAAFSLISASVFGVILAFYSPLVLGVLLTFTTLSTVWLLMFLKIRRSLDMKTFEIKSKEQDKLVEIVTGIQEVKLQNLEQQKRWEWEELAVRQFRVTQRALVINNIKDAGHTAIDTVGGLLVFGLIARGVIKGELSLGMMMSTQFILGQIAAPLKQLVGLIDSAQDARLSLERMGEIQRHEEEKHFLEAKSSDVPVGHDLYVHDLAFRYSGAGARDVLRHIHLRIPAGQTTAIVGSSGSGKTTLMKLLLGLHAPQSGGIYVGQTPLEAIDPRRWRENCGAVMQDGFIFPATIAANIACSPGGVNEAMLRAAAWMANLTDWIGSLPLGFNTRIGEDGQGLSGGQKQRLLLARAIYKNPAYLILDEATSSLDASNERTIMENLERFNQGRTVVVIAHRLSTVRHAQQIVVLHQGQIVEVGNHQSLVAARGYYYRLVANQLDIESVGTDQRGTHTATQSGGRAAMTVLPTL